MTITFHQPRPNTAHKMTSHGSEKQAKVDTYKDDKAWMVAYVADRRSRGVDPEGTLFEGEVRVRPEKVDEFGVRRCRNGHPATPETVKLVARNGGSGSYYLCLLCQKIRDKERNARRRELNATTKTPKVKTHCIHGHPWVPENLYTFKNGKVQCKTCQQEAVRKYRNAGRPQPHTHCRRGHEFTTENTYVRANGYRMCRACHRLRQRRRAAA